MQIKKNIVMACVVIAMLTSPIAAAEPHQHGVARCEIVVEAGTLEVTLIIPAISIIGFEHEPQTSAEKEKRQEAELSLLGAAGRELLAVPGARLTNLTLISEQHYQHTEENNEDAHTDEVAHVEPEAHSDFVLRYRFAMQNGDPAGRIDLSSFFRAYPDIEVVNWVALLPYGQRAGATAATNSRINLQ